MAQLSERLEKAYQGLLAAFEEREFTRQKAITALRETHPAWDEVYIDKATHELENAGLLMKDWGRSPVDHRRSTYRLVQLEDWKEATELNEEFLRTSLPRASFAKILDDLWSYVKGKLTDRVDLSPLPEKLSALVDAVAEEGLPRSSLRLVKAVDVSDLPDEEGDNVIRALKLFDASGNYYRSITNVYLEHKVLLRSLEEGEYSLSIGDYVTLDGAPLEEGGDIANKDLCPVCRRYPQTVQAQALITGEPKRDSSYQLYRATRSQIRVCKWCFVAGYVDLPLATIRKAGQAITKQKEYIYVNSPLSRDQLQALISKARGETEDISDAEEMPAGEEDPLIASLTDREKLRVSDFAVLGARARGTLIRVEGFVLPFDFGFGRVAGMAYPPDQLVGIGEKVSGVVREKLIAATLFDLHRCAKSEVHYGRIGRGILSVFGKPVSLAEAQRANRIFDICRRCRTDFRFPTAVFQLFFSDPHRAVNGIFRAFARRDEQYRPGSGKIEEVISMTDPVLDQEDWTFQLGLQLTDFLAGNRLIWGATSFRKPPELGGGAWSSVDLSKWLQNFKMVRDRDSAREWAKRVLSALAAGRTVDSERHPPSAATVETLMALIESIINACQERNVTLGEFSRRIADMDLYLLFYYTHRIRPAEREEETENPSI